MKIKIIADNVSYATENDRYETTGGIVSWVGTGKQTYKQNKNIAIEEKVNKFCANENIIVHSITPSVTMIDNNPPSAVMIYTIVYEDKE